MHNKPSITLSSETHLLDIKPKSNKLLIIFSATGTTSGKFNLYGLKNHIPHNLLYLRVPTNDWYQQGVPGLADSHEGTISAIKLIASTYGISEIFTCGSSMGAYGALLYGVDLECDVLALSPEIQLKLPFSRSTKMMPKNASVVYDDLRVRMKASSSTFYILTGECDPVDLYSADLVKSYVNTNIITFPKDEHTVLRTLVSNKQFLPLLWSFMDRNTLPTLEDTGEALDKEGFASNFYHGWVAYQSKNNDVAKPLLEKALNIYPISSYCQYIMANLLYRFKEYQVGKNHMVFAMALRPDLSEHHVGFAHYLRRIGLLEEAIKKHEEIQRKWPESYQSKYDLAMIYLEIGNKSLAKLHLTEVVKLQPKRQNYIKALAALE